MIGGYCGIARTLQNMMIGMYFRIIIVAVCSVLLGGIGTFAVEFRTVAGGLEPIDWHWERTSAKTSEI